MAGQLSVFVWEWHVPLLFFLSGCVENFRYDRNFITNVKSDVKGVIIPFFVFGIIALVFAALYGDYSYSYMQLMLKDLLMGVRRNTFFVTQIWFLSALFVMKILFQVTSIPKNKWITVLAGGIIWFLGNRFLYDDSTHIFWNIDSALHYYFYFLCGFVFFPLLRNIMYDAKFLILKRVLFVIFALYTIAVYYYLIPIHSFNGYLFYVLVLGIIIFQCLFASLFVGIRPINELGQQTLYLCGTEGVMNYFLAVVSEMIGIKWTCNTPLSICIRSLLCIVIISKLWYPWENKLIGYITRKSRL